MGEWILSRRDRLTMLCPEGASVMRPRAGWAHAPKGLEDSAQGFNLVSTLGNRPPERRALKGLQIERTNHTKARCNCNMSHLLVALAPSGRSVLLVGSQG